MVRENLVRELIDNLLKRSAELQMTDNEVISALCSLFTNMNVIAMRSGIFTMQTVDDMLQRIRQSIILHTAPTDGKPS